MAYCDPRRYYISDPLIYEDLVRKLAQFGSWLSHRYCLTLFSTDIWFDANTVADLDAALKNETDMDDTRLLRRDRIMTTEELLSQMSSMDYIITCRFHGVIFAHLMNIPVIALSHHPKVTAQMSDFGLSEYCLDIRTFDQELLRTTFSRMVSDKDRIKALMEEKVALYRNALTTQFDQLFFSDATK
jgi:polysaccharide pyruvyl transferase WcaK-like protein